MAYSKTIKKPSARTVPFTLNFKHTPGGRKNRVTLVPKNWAKKPVLTVPNNRTQKTKYPFIPLPLVNRLEALAEFYDISLVSRGKIPPNKTDKGFLVVFRDQAHGNPSKLGSLPILSKNPNGNTWDRQRDNYLLRRLDMIRRAKTNKPGGLWVQDGPLAGLPSVLHVNMMMWAYSPDAKMRTPAGVDKVLTRLKELKKKGIHAPKRPGISAYGNRTDA
jgi:hypothetical protein